MTADEIYDYERVKLAERFGWRLDYVDELNVVDLQKIKAVIMAEQRIQAKTAPKAKKK